MNFKDAKPGDLLTYQNDKDNITSDFFWNGTVFILISKQKGIFNIMVFIDNTVSKLYQNYFFTQEQPKFYKPYSPI